jgi:hypothetical protein
MQDLSSAFTRFELKRDTTSLLAERATARDRTTWVKCSAVGLWQAPDAPTHKISTSSLTTLHLRPNFSRHTLLVIAVAIFHAITILNDVGQAAKTRTRDQHTRGAG